MENSLGLQPKWKGKCGGIWNLQVWRREKFRVLERERVSEGFEAAKPTVSEIRFFESNGGRMWGPFIPSAIAFDVVAFANGSKGRCDLVIGGVKFWRAERVELFDFFIVSLGHFVFPMTLQLLGFDSFAVAKLGVDGVRGWVLDIGDVFFFGGVVAPPRAPRVKVGGWRQLHMDSCISLVVLRLLWFWLSGYAFPDPVAGMGWLFFVYNVEDGIPPFEFACGLLDICWTFVLCRVSGDLSAIGY
ncbi:hypothetical protein TIFTF001_010119 [Ficus carica]|uniref:Uncharacterized protein n=1 Tax=Ficus carica TaxID=3494 RepID=A0AA87ZR53_FICCA|nr:hypothetical protein TIFTF001_010119 [Ficus carica]